MLIKQLNQVTYASSLDDWKRELRSLVKVSEEFKYKDLLNITWDLEDGIEFKGKQIKVYISMEMTTKYLKV